MNPERTRFAPSPTGMLHIGGLRTALYAYLLAKQTKGSFILRIEDTDQQRSVDGGVENIVTTLDRMNIIPDEGFKINMGSIEEHGEFGPYKQSERLSVYREHAIKLIDQGDAYYCFCTKERLDEARKEMQKNKIQPKYDRKCLDLNDEEIHILLKSGEHHVVRLKVPEGKSTWLDVIRGQVTFDNNEIDDQVLIKSDGFPTYHLAVVVDDYLMKITTVIRGEEWVSSTPKHLMLYKSFGWDPPRFAHVPLLLNADKSKLSKRQGDVSASSYLEKGFLPEAVVNFVATLGYNPKGDREEYTIDELIELFQLHKVKKSGAVVNFEKLDWMNRQYIQRLELDDLKYKLKAFMKQGFPESFERVIEVERTRVSNLRELADTVELYTKSPDLTDPQIIIWKKSDGRDAIEMLSQVKELINNYEDEWSVERTETLIKDWISDRGFMTGNVLWPLRVTLSGKERSASPFEYLYVIGKEESINRISKAIVALKGD
jgi:glutamyl-tRNA synthetase